MSGERRDETGDGELAYLLVNHVLLVPQGHLLLRLEGEREGGREGGDGNL